jgi:hypothetical protein
MGQPAAKISDELLDNLIRREFPNDIAEVKQKLDTIVSDSQTGKNRFSAAVLKLANGDKTKIDLLVEKCNYDFRDIVAMAEYPKNLDTGFDEIAADKTKEIYDKDWSQYADWLNK